MDQTLVDRLRDDLPAIAVLPFFCIPHGTVDREFGQGVAFGIASALMTFREFNVISASSTLGYWGLDAPTRQIAQSLGARYIVSGQIVQADQTLTFKYTLKDVEVGQNHTFTPFDVHISDLHNVDAYIVERVITLILPRMRKAEIDKALTAKSSSLTAHETLLRAIAAMHNLSNASHHRAERLLLHAQGLDSHWAAPFAWHARLVSMRIGQGWVQDRRQAGRQALQLAQSALDRAPENALALATAGHLHSYLLKDVRTGMAMMQRAIEICPSEPYAWLMLGTSLAYIGRTKEARRHAEHAIRLSPLDPYAATFQFFHALCLYADGDYERAIVLARSAIEKSPNYSSTWRVLAASLAALGRVAQARQAGARILELEPDYPRFAKDLSPFLDPKQRQAYLSQLAVAGVLAPDAI